MSPVTCRPYPNCHNTPLHIISHHVASRLTASQAGSACVEPYPQLLKLQQRVVRLPGMTAFLGSDLHYPPGDAAYCEQVSIVLGRKIG